MLTDLINNLFRCNWENIFLDCAEKKKETFIGDALKKTPIKVKITSCEITKKAK